MYMHLRQFQSSCRLGASRPGTSFPRLSESMPPTTHGTGAYCCFPTLLSTPQTHDSHSTSASLNRLGMGYSIDQISRSAPPSAIPDLDSLVGHGSEPPTTPSHE